MLNRTAPQALSTDSHAPPPRVTPIVIPSPLLRSTPIVLHLKLFFLILIGRYKQLISYLLVILTKSITWKT